MINTLEIPKDILIASRMTIQDIKVEIAIHLYENKKLSIGKAKTLANMTIWEFQHLLASRKIPINYDIEEYNKDILTLERMDNLDDSK